MRPRAVVIVVGVICATVAAGMYLPPRVQEIQGRVVDAEGQGIAGVYYFAEFETGRVIPLPLDHGSPPLTCINYGAGVTDADGHYTIKRPVSLIRQALLALNPFLDIVVTFRVYRPGYAYAHVSHPEWWADMTFYHAKFHNFRWKNSPRRIELAADTMDPEQRLWYLQGSYPSASTTGCLTTLPVEFAEVQDQFRVWMRPEVEALMPRWKEDRHLKGRGSAVSPSIREFVVDVLGYDPLPPPENRTQGKPKPASPKCEDEPINSAR